MNTLQKTILTACYLQNTHLFIQRVQPQVHWAGEGERNSRKGEKDFPLFSIICICPGSRWRSGRGYYWAEYLPYTIENIAVGIDPDIDVGHNYLVLLCLLFIPEEGVRHPNFGRVRESEIVEFAWDTNSCQHKLSLRNGGLNGQWLCEYSDSPAFPRSKSEI